LAGPAHLRAGADPAAGALPRLRAGVLRAWPGAAGPAAPAPVPGLSGRRASSPRRADADPRTGRCCAWSPPGTATRRSPGGPGWPRESCAPTCKHLRQAAGIQPYRRDDQSLPRPGSRL